MTEERSNNIQQNIPAIFALITVQILFGINYVASKIIIKSVSPLIWAAFRLIMASLALYCIAIFRQRDRPALSPKFLVHMSLYALLGVVINQASFLVGLRYTTATNSAILNTLIPVFTLLFVTLAGQEPASPRRIVGFLMALLGVLVIRKVENFTLSDSTLIGDLLTILNCVSYALFLTLSKKFFSTYDTLWLTTWLFAFGSVGLSILSIPTWDSFQWPPLSTELIVCMAFSILGSTLLAYLLNNWALTRVRSSSVALFIYLQPVVASLLAWFWFGEAVTTRTVLASALIFGGMLLSISNRMKSIDSRH